MTINYTANDDLELPTGLVINGNLTVYAPNATVNNYATVSGTITITDVSGDTWNELVSGNDLVFEAEGKTLNIAEDVSVNSLTINKNATVITPKTVQAVVANGVKVIVKANEDMSDEDAVNIIGTESGEPVDLNPDESDSSTVDVNDFEGLKAAIEDDDIININIKSDIEVTEKLQIKSEKNIKGNDNTLTANDGNGWNSLYVLQFYKTEGSVKNLEITGGDAAILVNGSTVTVKDVNVSGNEFGGIEVSKGAGVDCEPKLTVNGNFEFSNENLPAIWIDGKTTNDNWVVGNGIKNLYEKTYIKDGKKQLWFVTTKPEEPDTENPEIDKDETKAELVGNKIVLTVVASDNGELAELEVDHNLGKHGVVSDGLLPEFTVPAESIDNLLGAIDEEKLEGLKEEIKSALEEAEVTFTKGTWTINFGTGLTELIANVAEQANAESIDFYIIVKDASGNNSNDGKFYKSESLKVNLSSLIESEEE